MRAAPYTIEQNWQSMAKVIVKAKNHTSTRAPATMLML
jgi:hypothetical protein